MRLGINLALGDKSPGDDTITVGGTVAGPTCVAAMMVMPGEIAGTSTAIWYDAALGVTQSSNKVSAWNDQGVGARHLVPLYDFDPNRPAYSATGGPDNKPAIVADSDVGVHSLFATFTRARPRTTYLVCKVDNATPNNALHDGGFVNEGRIYYDSLTHLPGLGNGTGFTVTLGLSLGSWSIVIFTQDGASSKIEQQSGTVFTGDDGGVTLTGITLLSLGGGFAVGKCRLAEVWDFPAAHSTGEKAAMIAYLQAKYPSIT